MNQPLPEIDALAPTAIVDPILGALRGARAVQIVGHVRPDGDCIGSMLAMRGLLAHFGIPCAMAAAAIPPSAYDELDGFEFIRETPAAELNSDLTVYVDCASEERGPDGFRAATPVINIDHHGSNTRYGKWQWIESRYSSVGEMMLDLHDRAGVPLTPQVAMALLVAITTDTGSFRFGNTAARQHLAAARLIAAGADAKEVARLAYGSMSPDGARLVGHVLANIRLESGGRLSWSEVRRATYDACGGEANAPENLCDGLRNLRDVEVALLFHEVGEAGIRVNLRSSGAFNVSRLAAEWGGGGHAAAAGLTLDAGDYATLRDQILARAIEWLA